MDKTNFSRSDLYIPWWKHVHICVPLIKLSAYEAGGGGVAPQLWRNFQKLAPTPFGQNFTLSGAKMLVTNGLCVGQPPRFFLPVRLWIKNILLDSLLLLFGGCLSEATQQTEESNVHVPKTMVFTSLFTIWLQSPF